MKHDDPRYLEKIGRAGTVKGIPGRAAARVDGQGQQRFRNTGVDPRWAEYEDRKRIYLSSRAGIATPEDIEKAFMKFARELGL